MRAFYLIIAALLVLPTVARGQTTFPFDPTKGGIEAEGPGKKKKTIRLLPAGDEAGQKVIVSPAKAAILECDGKFRGTVKVRSRVAGPARQFTVASPAYAEKNVVGVKLIPTRFKLAQDGLKTIDVSGALKYNCKKGSLGILVSWLVADKKGRQTQAKTGGTFGIAPFVLVKLRLPIPVRGRFNRYNRQIYKFGFSFPFECCPRTSGQYEIAIDRSTNVHKIKIKRTSFVCSPGDDPYRRHETLISGRLTDHSKPGTADIKITRVGGASCLARAEISPPKRTR